MFAEPGRDPERLRDSGSEAVRERIVEEALKLDPEFPLAGRLRERADELRRAEGARAR